MGFLIHEQAFVDRQMCVYVLRREHSKAQRSHIHKDTHFLQIVVCLLDFPMHLAPLHP